MNTQKRYLSILGFTSLPLVILMSSLLFSRTLVAQVRKPTATVALTVVPPNFTPVPTQEPAPASASVSGLVWHDLCAVAGDEGGVPLTPSAGCVPAGEGGYGANGLLEIHEPGLGGVMVQLGQGACPAFGLSMAATSMNGMFSFAGLQAGVYCVSVDASRLENALLLPGGWTSPPVSRSSFAGYTITLLDGEQRTGLNFGWDYQFLPKPDPVATLAPVSPQPTATAPPVAPTSEARCTDLAAFVRDVTIPDQTRLLPGQAFVKTWRLRNSGRCTWSTDYALVFASGHSLGGPLAVPLSGPVAPGATVDLSVTLVAPTGNGAYEGKWQLRNAEGERFGLGKDGDAPFWVKIVVGPPSTATPAPSLVVNWRGEYYPNRNLTGTPRLVRDDAAINFDWGAGAPAASLPADGFSARWTRAWNFEDGLYQFYMAVDDGARLYVDETLVVSSWQDGGRRWVSGEYRVSAGYHNLRLEYYERGGDATIVLWWDRLDTYPDWRGEYWSNLTLSGSPTLIRNDARVDFDWKRGAPASGLPADGFAARWTKKAHFDAATYRFHLVVDDGARLWVGNQLLIDSWRDGAARELTADLPLVQGQHHVQLEYYERTGDAQVRLWWEEVPPASFSDWKGEYWSSRSLNGAPALLRNDKDIDFRWGKGAPASGLPADNFAARWSRRVTFGPGVYRFNAWADDGLRFYLDGVLLLNEWHDNDGKTVYTTDATLAGPHNLVVEYYENRDEALVKFWWKRVADWPTPTPVPPTPTPVPPTPTPTPVPPTPTPTPTPVITETLVLLNEVLPAPATVDWDGNGVADERDEWIELYNTGPVTVELGGWIVSSGTDVYHIPDGAVLPPGALAVFYRQETGLVLNDAGGVVHLVEPAGTIVDSVAFSALTPDASFSRDDAGFWHTDWPPSPGRLNLPSTPVLILDDLAAPVVH